MSVLNPVLEPKVSSLEEEGEQNPSADLHVANDLEKPSDPNIPTPGLDTSTKAA